MATRDWRSSRIPQTIVKVNLLLEGEKSERLSFRKITPSDFDSWLPFHQDPRSTQYWEGVKEAPLELQKNAKILQKNMP